jgi:hypothetical protein
MPRTLLLALLLTLSLGQIVISDTSRIIQLKVQPCVGFQLGNCISCPYNYHVNDNQCYLNITNCLNYSFNNMG